MFVCAGASVCLRAYALRIVSMAKSLRFTHTLIIIKWVHSILLVAVGNPVTSTVRRGFSVTGKTVRSSVAGCLPPPLLTLTS